MADFPLNQWFDLSQPISEDDQEMCEAQMGLYAFKDGDDPDGKEFQDACKDLNKAVKRHNASFGS